MSNAYQGLVSETVGELLRSDLLFESTFGTELIGTCYPSVISLLNGNEWPALWVPGEENERPLLATEKNSQF